MRLFYVGLLALSLTSCKSALTSLVAFEGEVEMSVGTPLPGISPAISTSNILFKMKGHKVRTDIGIFGMTISNISDSDTQKTYQLDSAARTYMEIDMRAAKAAASVKPAKPNITATGRKDTVAGYACEIYGAEDPAHTYKMETCVASGITMFIMGLAGPFSAFGDDEMWGAITAKGFPLRIVMMDGSGAVMAKIEATRIERKKEPSADFEIPAGYKKVASPTL